MTLRNLLIALAVVALAGFVLADALPDQSTLTFRDGGTQIGTGSYVNGDLSVSLTSDSVTGATLTVTTRGGDTLTYTVDITVTDGTAVITLADGTPLYDINPSIAARGGTVQYCVGVSDGTNCTSPTLSSPGPNAHANPNAFQKSGNKNDGMNNAAAAARNGSGGSHANPRAGNGAGNAAH